jgi:SP family general alpha glucoside:H+ symporter-like MFS transporter
MTTKPYDNRLDESNSPLQAPKTMIQENEDEAQEAIEIENSLSFFEAVKLYPKAIGWSVFFSLGVIM